MYADLGQLFSDAYFIVLGEDNTGLLLAVPERDIVDPHLLRRVESLGHLRKIIPRADKPVIGLP
jgi:hypothetical protein